MKSNNQYFSEKTVNILTSGKILGSGETPEKMLERVVNSVFDVEGSFNARPVDIEKYKVQFLSYIREQKIILGSPILTNAGRDGLPLSSCVAIPVDFKNQSFEEIVSIIEPYYLQNMGSGFDLSNHKSPCSMLKALNEHAARETHTGKYERYIGNMGNVDIDHPEIINFTKLKCEDLTLKHFNISVNISSAFMQACLTGGDFKLRNQQIVTARNLWNHIVKSAWESGDPGLLFLENFNKDNPTPSLGAYRTTAPCAEMGLASGETCVFAYINVSKFISGNGSLSRFNFSSLEEIIPLATRALDNCLEISLNNYSTYQSTSIMRAKRKIGIGICGFADLLVALGLPYESSAAKVLLKDILTTISFYSKVESIELAKQRGSFLGLPLSVYSTQREHLTKKFANSSVNVITSKEWRALDNLISIRGLRNSVTTALPPSGRSALILEASNSIEPWFSLLDTDGQPNSLINNYLENYEEGALREMVLDEIKLRDTCQHLITTKSKQVLKKAIEISPMEQLQILKDASDCIDEGVSKTINLPFHTTLDDIDRIYMRAWEFGLKAISVYRDGSKVQQPESLSQHKLK